MQVTVWQIKKNMLVFLGKREYTYESPQQAAISFLRDNPKKCEVPKAVINARHLTGGYDWEVMKKYFTLQEI